MRFSAEDAKGILAFEQRVRDGFFGNLARESDHRLSQDEMPASVVKVQRRSVVQGTCISRLVPCTI